MDKLFNEFINFRKNKGNAVKDSTFKIYKRNIKNIIILLKGKNFIFTDMDIFLDYKKVFDKIEDFSIDKKKKIINAIMVFFMEKEKYKDTKNIYYKYKQQLEKKITERRKEQFKTEKESKNWLSFSELIHVVNNYKKNFIFLDKKVKKLVSEGIKVRLSFDNKNNVKNSNSYILSKKDEQTILNYLITQLYCGDPFYHGPRRSVYSTFRIISMDNYEKINEKDREKMNLLIIKNKSNKKFQFSEYKTSSYHEKPFKIILSKRMSKVINDVMPYLLLYYKNYYDPKWYKLSFNIPLIRNINTRKQATSYNMTTIIQNIFKCTKCNISVNSLRKILITEFYKKPRTKKEKEKYAESCGHSIATAEYTYNKMENN